MIDHDSEGHRLCSDHNQTGPERTSFVLETFGPAFLSSTVGSHVIAPRTGCTLPAYTVSKTKQI